jgi:hypothetical protein
MAMAKELAQDRRVREDPSDCELPVKHEDREVQPDRPAVKPAIRSARSKGSTELTIGCYILLLIGVAVLSVRLSAGQAAGAGTPETTALGQAKSADASDHSSSSGNQTTPGIATPIIRFVELGCASAACTVGCDAGERILNAYMLGPGATFTYESDRSMTVRPARLPSGKIVVVCMEQQQ